MHHFVYAFMYIGTVFGADQPIRLQLLDIPMCKDKLDAVVMEVEDSAYPLVEEVIPSTDPMVGLNGAHYAILVGGFPRMKGMLRKDLLAKNYPIFVEQGNALNTVADKNVKVLVVANPANTNCLTLMNACPSIPRENFSAMSRLDLNRAKGVIAKKANVAVRDVKNIIVWGNHSVTMVPDIENASIHGKSVRDMVKDDAWLETEFAPFVQTRGAKVIQKRGLSSACSAAYAAADHMRSWVQGTPEDETVSMAVCSDRNPFGVPEGLIYSFPVKTREGKWYFAEDSKVDTIRNALKITADELIKERESCMAVPV